MSVSVNGTVRSLLEGTTVADVVSDLLGAPDPPGVAVALNGEVVPRSRWPATNLREDDRVEVLNAIGGG